MGASGEYDVKECGLSAWLSSGSAEGIVPTTNRTPPPFRLQNPQDAHDASCCVRPMNTRNRREEMLLFGKGGSDIARRSLSNQRVAPGLVQL